MSLHVGIVGLPGEMFSEFGMEIKKRSPAKHTLVIELANDGIGYLPTSVSFEQGGYEPSTGSTMYVKGAGEKLVPHVLQTDADATRLGSGRHLPKCLPQVVPGLLVDALQQIEGV